MMTGPAESFQGKLFIGLIINVMLFGINITQTYFYYIHSKKDRLWIKISVAIILVADFVQPLFLSIYLYRTLIVHFGNETILSRATNLFAVVPTMTGLTGSIVQIFFAWRIRILTNNWYSVALIIAAAVSEAVCAIVVAYLGGINPMFVKFKAFQAVATTGVVSQMLGDIMIASILVWFLQTHKSGFRQSDEMVDRIIRFTLQTGLLTLVLGGTNMLLYLMQWAGGTYLLLNIVRSKIYTSSLLSSLNSRQGWGYDTSESSGEVSTNLGSLRFASDSESMTDRTSAVITITTPPETELELTTVPTS